VTDCFLCQLCWKVALDTTKIVNHAKKLKMCNWSLLPCCVPSLSEGRFMIEVYISLAISFILGRLLMYFSGHISSQRVFILLCGSEHAVIKIVNN
jgi:hypothetical protein